MGLPQISEGISPKADRNSGDTPPHCWSGSCYPQSRRRAEGNARGHDPLFNERKTKFMSITLQELQQFTGTSRWYRHWLFRNYLYTDGVQYLAEKAGAYWLIDTILSHQQDKRLTSNDELAYFQCWTLNVKGDNSAQLICDDGNKNIILTQELEFTDFPLPTITLWLEHKVLLLPSEH